MAKIRQRKMNTFAHISACSLLSSFPSNVDSIPRALPGWQALNRLPVNVNYISEFKTCLLPLQDFSLARRAAGQRIKSSLYFEVPKEDSLPTGWCRSPMSKRGATDLASGVCGLCLFFLNRDCPEPLIFLSIAGCAGTVQVKHKVSIPALVLLVTYLIYCKQRLKQSPGPGHLTHCGPDLNLVCFANSRLWL